MKPVVNIVFFVVVCCSKLVAAGPFPEDFARYLAAAYSSATATDGLRDNLQNQQTDYRRAQRQLTGYDNQFNNAHSQPTYPSTLNAGVDRNRPANNENINFNGPREIFNQAPNSFGAVGDSLRYPQAVANEPPILPINRMPSQQTQFYGIPQQQNFEQSNQMRNIPEPIRFKINNKAQEVKIPFLPLEEQRNVFPEMNIVQQPFIPQKALLNRIRDVPPNPLPVSQQRSITNHHVVPPSNYQQSPLQVGNSNDPSPYKKQKSKYPSSINDPNIQRIITENKSKKRYLVIHPNGNIEHLDSLDDIIHKHPNHVIINSEHREAPKSVIEHNDPNNLVPNINNNGMRPNPDLQNRATGIASENRHSNIVPILDDNKTTQIHTTNKNETHTEKKEKTDVSPKINSKIPIKQKDNLSKKEHDNKQVKNINKKKINVFEIVPDDSVNATKPTLLKKVPPSPVMTTVPAVKSNKNSSQKSIKVKVINDDGSIKTEKNNTSLNTSSENVATDQSLSTQIKKPQAEAPKTKFDESSTKHVNKTEPSSKLNQPSLDEKNSPKNKNPAILEVIPIKSKLNISTESTSKSSIINKEKPGAIIKPSGNVNSSDSKQNNNNNKQTIKYSNAVKNKKFDKVLLKNDLSTVKAKPDLNQAKIGAIIKPSGNVNSSDSKQNNNKQTIKHSNAVKNKKFDKVLPKNDLSAVQAKPDHKSKAKIEAKNVNNQTTNTTNDKKNTTTVNTPLKQSNATASTTTTIDNTSYSNNVSSKKHLHNESSLNNKNNKTMPVKMTEKRNATLYLKESSDKDNTTKATTPTASTTKQSGHCLNSTSTSKLHKKHIEKDVTEDHLKKMLEKIKNLTDEDYIDKVVIFQIVMPPVVDKEVHTTIYPNGTIIDKITETIWDTEDEYGEPEVFTKTHVRHIDDSTEDEHEE